MTLKSKTKGFQKEITTSKGKTKGSHFLSQSAQVKSEKCPAVIKVANNLNISNRAVAAADSIVASRNLVVRGLLAFCRHLG